LVSYSRVPFDPGLPFIVAAQELVWNSAQLVRGDTFDWRALGVSELDLLQLWTFYKVDCVVPPDETKVETPKAKQKRQRAAQRAPE
jgi:hypothetical protein